MATQDFKNSAAKAFREHYDKLVKSIQEADLPVLGAQFFSRQIISTETMEMVGNVSTSRALRVSKLMLAVMAHLDVHPDKFESALDVFREELVYADFASLIASSVGKCCITETYTLIWVLLYLIILIQLILFYFNYNLGFGTIHIYNSDCVYS